MAKKKKQAESIWTKDITPDIVAFMTMDITPDFKSEVWTKDITHHVIGTLAVFGLVVSSLVTTLGVAAVGVNIEVAFAQQESANQTASLVLANAEHPLMQIASGTLPQHPPMGVRAAAMLGSSTVSSLSMASSTPGFCPKIGRTIGRGSHEATTTGDVGQLQRFIANHFGLNPSDVVTGFFGSTTQAYLQKFQEEQGISPAPMAGPLTRAAIARLCNPSSHDPAATVGDVNRDGHMGSSTMVGSTTPPTSLHRDDMRPNMMGSTTEPTDQPTMPPPPPLPPTVVAPAPVTYTNDQQPNSASVFEAVNEIGDGYTKLLQASLTILGF